MKKQETNQNGNRTKRNEIPRRPRRMQNLKIFKNKLKKQIQANLCATAITIIKLNYNQD